MRRPETRQVAWLTVVLAVGLFLGAGPLSAGESGARMQGGAPPPDARDPHAYAEGFDFGAIARPRFADEQVFASFLSDQLEWVHAGDGNGFAYDAQAWFGYDYDRLVVKAEGDLSGGEFGESRTELLWGHAVAAFWDTQIGVRHDGGEGPGRNWLTFGVQGLAPYWFEIDAAAYVGTSGRTALRLDASYELLLTQRLILEPQIESDFYGRADPARGLGSGLAELVAGLRLRYEIRREFAPYLGVEWSGRLGQTADLARAAGEDTADTRLVAGVRLWF